jgi:D-hydroxyproline dehydrogenase subunit gamma
MSSETIEIVVDGRPSETTARLSVASALLNAGIVMFRRSEHGDPRGPLCGMGVCYECRVTINGVPHQRACMTTVAPGMSIGTTATPSPDR